MAQTGVADVDGVFGEESGGMHEVWGSEGIAKEVKSAKLVLLDGNLCVSDLRKIVRICRTMGKDVWFEPTSVTKSTRIAEAGIIGEVRYMSPNISEALAMSAWIRGNKGTDRKFHDGNESGEDEIETAGRTILGVSGTDKRVLLVTRGAKGVLRMSQQDDGQISRSDIMATVVDNVVSTTGAGDCLAGRCAGGIAAGEVLDVALSEAMRLAELCCGCETSVPARRNGRISCRL